MSALAQETSPPPIINPPQMDIVKMEQELAPLTPLPPDSPCGPDQTTNGGSPTGSHFSPKDSPEALWREPRPAEAASALSSPSSISHSTRLSSPTDRNEASSQPEEPAGISPFLEVHERFQELQDVLEAWGKMVAGIRSMEDGLWTRKSDGHSNSDSDSSAEPCRNEGHKYNPDDYSVGDPDPMFLVNDGPGSGDRSHVRVEGAIRATLQDALEKVEKAAMSKGIERQAGRSTSLLETLADWEVKFSAETSDAFFSIFEYLRAAREAANKLTGWQATDACLAGAYRRFFKCRLFGEEMRDMLDDSLSGGNIPKVLFTRDDLSRCTEYWRWSRFKLQTPLCRLDPIQKSWADYFFVRDQMLEEFQHLTSTNSARYKDYAKVDSSHYDGLEQLSRCFMDCVKQIETLEKTILDTESDQSIWKNPFTGRQEQAGSAFWPAEGWRSAFTEEQYIRGVEKLIVRYQLLSRIAADPAKWDMYNKDFGAFMTRRELLDFDVNCNGRQGYYCPNLRLE